MPAAVPIALDDPALTVIPADRRAEPVTVFVTPVDQQLRELLLGINCKFLQGCPPTNKFDVPQFKGTIDTIPVRVPLPAELNAYKQKLRDFFKKIDRSYGYDDRELNIVLHWLFRYLLDHSIEMQLDKKLIGQLESGRDQSAFINPWVAIGISLVMAAITIFFSLCAFGFPLTVEHIAEIVLGSTAVSCLFVGTFLQFNDLRVPNVYNPNALYVERHWKAFAIGGAILFGLGTALLCFFSGGLGGVPFIVLSNNVAAIEAIKFLVGFLIGSLSFGPYVGYGIAKFVNWIGAKCFPGKSVEEGSSAGAAVHAANIVVPPLSELRPPSPGPRVSSDHQERYLYGSVASVDGFKSTASTASARSSTATPAPVPPAVAPAELKTEPPAPVAAAKSAEPSAAPPPVENIPAARSAHVASAYSLAAITGDSLRNVWTGPPPGSQIPRGHIAQDLPPLVPNPSGYSVVRVSQARVAKDPRYQTLEQQLAGYELDLSQSHASAAPPIPPPVIVPTPVASARPANFHCGTWSGCPLEHPAHENRGELAAPIGSNAAIAKAVLS